MLIPQTGRKKALFIIDVQQSFVLDRNKYIIPNIIKLINEGQYDLIIYSVQKNDKDSLWYKQIGRYDDILETDTITEIQEALKSKNVIKVNKLTRSIYKGDKDILKILKQNNIEEIHISGFETNDCVFAATLESFDLGFYTFVIEEATETGTTASNHQKAIDLLRYLKLTNNSDYVGKISGK